MNACLSLRPCNLPFLTVLLVQPTRNSRTHVVAGHLYSLQATAGRLSWRDTCTAYKQQQNGRCGGILVQLTRNSRTHVVAGYLYSLQATAERLVWRDTCTAYKEQQNGWCGRLLVQPTRNSTTLVVTGYLYSLQGTAESGRVTCTTDCQKRHIAGPTIPTGPTIHTFLLLQRSECLSVTQSMQASEQRMRRDDFNEGG